MTEVTLAFGSNLGDRVLQIQGAIDRLLDSGLRCKAISSCYNTKAVGLIDQPDFLNAAGRFSCIGYSAFEVLRIILKIEAEMGRVRTIENGPRLIDIDLIFFGRSIIVTNNLTVPHPGFALRQFVLEPLCELMPDFQPPGMGGLSLTALLKKCPDVDSMPVKAEGVCLVPTGG